MKLYIGGKYGLTVSIRQFKERQLISFAGGDYVKTTN